MSYVLGVDIGTTFTAAAVCPLPSPNAQPGRPAMLSLGSNSYAVPSVLFLREDGSFLAGEAAELRSSADPVRVARYFKRRLGDEVPIRLAGTPFAPQVLVTRLLEWVIEQASTREGAAPDSVVLTHPANWGPYRRELLQQAAAMAGVSRPRLIAEPEAAAIHYVQSERIEPGELIAVYDLGGGTFDAVVMRRTENGFETVGQPAGVDRLGGMDFDDVIRSFVLDAADLDDIEQSEEAVTAAYALQSSCIDAKRVLSADTVADVRVVFPGISTSVRVNRGEFEDRIRPRLLETLSAVQTAMDSADATPEHLSRILLVGGSSRIPLVSALLAQKFGRPLAVDSDPKNAVALGAAVFGAGRAGSGSQPAPPEPPRNPVEREQATAAPATQSQVTESQVTQSQVTPAPVVPTPLPSTESATARTHTPEPDPAPPDTASSELFSVRAESGHRTRIPQPSDSPTLPPETPSTPVEAVGPDPRLFILGAVVAVAVVAIIVILAL